MLRRRFSFDGHSIAPPPKGSLKKKETFFRLALGGIFIIGITGCGLHFRRFFRILHPYYNNEVMTMRLLIAEDELDLAEALTVFF